MVIGFLPRFSRSQYSEFIFSFLWCCGLFFGALFSSECSNFFSFWMRTMDPSGVSIVWLFTALFLPFLFSAVAVYLHQSWLLFLLAFIKAFIFGLCLCGVASACGSAGWIICVLLFFSESSLFPVLFFCMKRFLGRPGYFSKTEITGLAALVFLIVSIDRCVISPFLANLI